MVTILAVMVIGVVTWPLFSSPTDLDITVDTTWNGDQTITGTLTVKTGVTLTINSSAGTAITINAVNLVVESGAKISADGKGYAGGTARNNGGGTGYGKGVGASNVRSAGGAGYGGVGGDGTDYAGSGGTTYGSSTPPFTNGSGGGGGQTLTGGAGGGAIRLIISGTTTLNGPVQANGADGTGTPYGSGAGSGGSIYLSTAILEGDSDITANGGSAVAGSGGAGGGGRVAVYYDYAGGYSGTVEAAAGTTGAGTPGDGSADQTTYSTGGVSGPGPMGVYPNALFTGGSSGTGPKGVGYYYSSTDTIAVWDGGGADNLASTAANWTGDTLPVTGVSVYFNETSGKNCTWDLTTVSPANFTLDTGYTGTVTLSGTPDEDLTVTDTFRINTGGGTLVDNGRTVNFKNALIAGDVAHLTSTGTWKMTTSGTVSNSNYYDQNPFKLMELAPGVTATAADKVVTKKVVLGDNSHFNSAYDLWLQDIQENDFIVQGSGATINFNLLRFYTNLNLNQGAFSATGNLECFGGGVFTMTGDWNISEHVQLYGHAGGGIPVILDTNGHNLTVGSYLALGSSDPSWPNGNLGKILFKTGTHSIGGKIYVSGGHFAAGGTCYTHGFIDFGSSTVNVGGDVDFRGASVVPGTSTVNLTGADAATVYSIVDYAYKDVTEPWRDDLVLDTAPFYNLTSSVAGKTVTFESGKTVTVAGNMTFAGADGNLLTLNSSADDSEAFVNVAGGAKNMNWLSVKDSNASGKGIVAYNSTNVSGNTNWIFGAPGSVYWINASGDGKWSTAENWSTGSVPVTTDSVYFTTAAGSGAGSNCSVDQAAEVTNFTLDTGYTGTVTLSGTEGQDLTVTNTIEVKTNGGKIVDNGRTVNFKNASIANESSRLTSTGTWKMTANGSVNCPAYGQAIYILELVAGVTADITSAVYTKKLVQGGNSGLTGGSLILFGPLDNFISQAAGATITCSGVSIMASTGTKSVGALTITSNLDTYVSTGTLIMTGPWNIGGNLLVRASNGTTCVIVDTNGYDLTVNGDLMFGYNFAGAPGGFPGKVLFGSGTHSIGGKIYVNGGHLAAGGTCYTHGFIDLGSSTVNVGGNVDLRGMSVVPGTSTVNLTGTGAATVYSIVDYAYKDVTEPWRDDLVLNTAPFYNLTSSAAGKTVKFEAGKTVTVAGNMTFAGASGNLLTLNSSADGSEAFVSVSGTATDMDYLSVKDSNATGKGIIAYNSTNVSGNTNWYFGEAGKVYWMNATGDGKWSTAENWSTGAVPIATDSVYFNTISGSDCSVDQAAEVTNFTLDTGYTGTVTLSGIEGQDLTVTNTIAVNTNGGILVDNSRTVNFKNASIAKDTAHLTSTGTWKMTASGTLANPSSSNPFKLLELSSGITATSSDNVWTKKIILGDNSHYNGNDDLRVSSMAENDFIVQGSGATITCNAIRLYPSADVSQGAFSVTGSVYQNDRVYVLTMTGDWNISGFFRIYGTTSEAATLDTNGHNLTVGSYLELGLNSASYPNGYRGKILFKTGTHSIGGDFYVDGGSNLATCFTHGYIDFGSSAVNIGGNVDFRGASVAPGTSTVNLTGTGAATIYSIVDYDYIDETEPWRDDLVLNTAPFYNLTSSVAGKTVKFEAGKTVTVENNLTLAGASGNLLTLNSSADGSYANLKIGASGGATGMDYLSVKDSDASSGKRIVTFNSTNGGHNNYWAFSGPGDHLAFASSISTPQQVGAVINLSQIEARDSYNNILGNFTGSKTISYSLSGLSNAPDGNGTDVFYSGGVEDGPVTFVNGVSTSTLTAELYRAQDTTITPSEASLPGTDEASNIITVDPASAAKLAYTQQPSTTAVITAPFVQQPRVAIQDTYGNRTHDTFSIKLFPSATSEPPYGDSGGILSSDHTDNTLEAVNGLAIYSGVRYDRADVIYLYAQGQGVASGLTPAFSTSVTLDAAATTDVTASATPVQNFNLVPTNDSIAEKFAVLKFKITDYGNDNIPTQIDQIKVEIGGSGGNASTDIAWAGLYDGATPVASASSITDNYIIFGNDPDGNAAADLVNIADDTSTEFTVYIFMKSSKLTATDSQSYTFITNEDLVGADLGVASSHMAPNSSSIATVTGTIKVDVSHLEVVTVDGDTMVTLTAGVPFELMVRAIDANRNIDINYAGNRTMVFSGLNPVSSFNPKIESTPFGMNTTIGFTLGVSNLNVVTITAYKRENGTVMVSENGKSYLGYGMAATVSPSDAASIAVLSGNNQSGRISWPLANPMIALVTDMYTNPVVSGTSVNFAIVTQPNGATGAQLSVLAGSTDDNGQVASTLTVGDLAGAYVVHATSAGLAGSPVAFTATALVPSEIQIYGGNAQSKQVGAALDNPLIVKVVDSGGIAIPNEMVSFEITSIPDGASGQELSDDSQLTDTNGLSQTELTLGDKIGDYKVTASSGSLTPVEFTATATPRTPYQVSVTGPVSIKAGIMSEAYTVMIQDEYGNETPLSSNTTFSLVENPSRPNGDFYADSGGGQVISSITIPSGSSSNTFYYKDTSVGTANLFVTRTSGQVLTVITDSVSVSVMPADAYRFTVVGSTASISTGGTKTLTLTAYDDQGNVKTDYAGDVNVVFSGANMSPSPSLKKATCTNKNGQDIEFGSSTTLLFNSGVATTTAKLYKAESVMLKATSGTVGTADEDALSFIVIHGAPDHLKFAGNLPTPLMAGVSFDFDTTVNAVDFYDNTTDGANGGEVFDGSRQITWDLSGEDNGPEGNVFDVFVSPVTFVAGVSTTPLSATLYRAQNTTITPITAALTGVNAPSNMLTVNSGPAAKLRFSQEPAAFCVTNQPLTTQPKVAVSDQYGNPVSSTPANVTIEGSTTTGTFTPVVNGELTATGGLTVTTVNGVASYEGMTYSYPELVYLRASISGLGLTPVYSSGITFSTSADAVFTQGAAGASEIPSIANSSPSKVVVMNFRITDGGTDGFSTKIRQIIVKRDAGDESEGWPNYIFGASMSDGVTTVVGRVEDDQLSFGLGTNDIYAVTNGTIKNFSVSVFLKDPLPEDSDNTQFALKLDPATDILLGSPSSTLAEADAITAAPKIAVTATDFKVTGNASMNAGESQEVWIEAMDTLGNRDHDYAGEKVLLFSGASVSLKGNQPIETSSGFPFGTETPVSFIAGQSSSTVGIRLFAAETALVKATESSTGIATANVNALNVIVHGGVAVGLSWYTQPVASAVIDTTWKDFSIVVVDEYGNTSSSTSAVTVVPSEGNLAAGATGTVTAQGGFATFYNFAVTNIDDGEQITLTGSSPGLTSTPKSNAVTIAGQFSIVLNVKDSVTLGGLTNVSLTITDTDTGELIIVPTHNSPWTGNSPFQDNFKLSAGNYTFSLERDEYVAKSQDVTVSSTQDGLDGSYDAKINWNIFMTSIAESMADYKAIGDFVYDEANDVLNITQRLERRGRQIVSDGINNLGAGTIKFYDGSTLIGAITGAADAQGNYWYSIPDATTVVPSGSYVLMPFTAKFVSGKTYFARCEISYGGVAGDLTSYASGTTFTITVMERLSNEIINAIGIEPGTETLAERIAAVQGSVTTVGDKVDTATGTLTTEIQNVGTQVTGVNSAVSSVSSKITTVQGTVGAIQSEVTTTLPGKIQASLDKGVLSEILTRNTIVREDDEIKIRYRTASGLAPTLTVYDLDGNAIADYNAVVMTEIANTGIYEYAVTATMDWGEAGDYTVECAEATKGSKDSMILTLKALYVAGAGVEDSIDAVGEAVTKVYQRQKTFEALLGSVADTQKNETVFGKIKGVSSKLDGYNLSTVSTDIREAKENAENVYNEMKNLTGGLSDFSAQVKAFRSLTSQLEEMRANLGKLSKGLVSSGVIGGEAGIGGGTSIITAEGEGAAAAGLSAENQQELLDVMKDVQATISQEDRVEVSNRVEELTALVKVLEQMVENKGNEPIIEGWFEQA